MDIRSFFFDERGLLRSGWRFIIFVLGFAVAVLIAGGFVGLTLQVLGLTNGGSSWTILANSLSALVPALLVGWLCGKFLEGLPFRALGAWFTNGWLRNLIAGILIGAATVSLAVLIAVAFGGLTFSWNPLDAAVVGRSLAVSFLIFGIGAAWEEAVFRGYILQTLARSGFAWLGIGLTSLFFAAIHLGNPNATAISTIDTAIAGIWFGVAYLKTRDLWFVWGLHLMWNWMLGSFFGIEVSGLTNLVSAPLLKEIDSGPVWLTGETYGIEGGIASTISLAISIAVIYFAPWPTASAEMKALTDPKPSSAEGAAVI
jgi:membrane protease YdiL (CAAX protease family)